MFITAEDFNTEPYRLHNLDQAEDFADFVQREEEEVLLRILGMELYKAFIDALFTFADGVYTPKEEEEIEQRWKDLRDGVQYTHYGRHFKWEGMVKALRPYVYALWLKYKEETLSGTGAVIPAAENATVIPASNKIVRGYNEFSKLIGSEYCEISMYDTLFGYLFLSEDKYTDSVGDGFTSITDYLYWRFEPPGKMNVFNL